MRNAMTERCERSTLAETNSCSNGYFGGVFLALEALSPEIA
jgi:hypothetical protein